MIGIVSRLTDQKGFDLVAYVMDELCQDDIQFVVLGTGDGQYEDFFRWKAGQYPGRLSAQILYAEDLSRRIYAAADLFLMPSSSEPCGLSQMIAMRYGAVPIVRSTGGAPARWGRRTAPATCSATMTPGPCSPSSVRPPACTGATGQASTPFDTVA